MIKLMATFLLLTFAQYSYAERLMPMEFIGQPLMLLDEGNLQSCGIRIVGVQFPVDTNNPNELLWSADGSFMVNRNGYGLVKATASQITLNDITIQKASTNKTLKSFWFKAEGVKATTPLTKVIQGEQKYSLLYSTNAESVLGLYRSVLNDKSIQFALKFEKGAQDVAFYGTVNIQKEELQQVISCMNELAALVTKDTKLEGKK